MTSGSSLSMAVTHPDLASEFHPEKNSPLSPYELVSGTNKKLWWICKAVSENPCGHIWQAFGGNRSRKSQGCPVCNNKAVHIDGRNSMRMTHPKLAKEFHKELNRDLLPENLIASTSKKIVWMCIKCDNIWKTTGHHRVKRSQNCPSCAGKKLHSDGRNSMLKTHPDLASEFHPTRNKGLSPISLLAGTNKKIWWICKTISENPCENVWKAQSSSRIQGAGCPSCSGHKLHSDGRNSMLKTHPDLASEFHPNKNKGLSPISLKAGTNKKIWWICKTISENPCGHIWQTAGTERMRHGCPKCGIIKASKSQSMPKKGESLLDTNPEIAAEWHPELNGKLTPRDISIGSGKYIWWRCKKGEDHVWKSVSYTRKSGSGCPFCSGKKVSKTNSVSTVMPEVAKEWHPTKNGEIKPSQIVAGSSKPIWWICKSVSENPCGNEWKVSAENRKYGTGCPKCGIIKRGRIRSVAKFENSIASLRPELVDEWDFDKNTSTPDKINSSSNKNFWWICKSISDSPCGNKWKTSATSRVDKGTGCPFCANQKVSSVNNMGVMFPFTLEIWHPTKNGNITPFDILPRTGKKYWWKCPKADDHVFFKNGNEVLRSITSEKNDDRIGCPMCKGRIVVESNCIQTTHNYEVLSEWDIEKTGFTPKDVVIGTSKRVWWRCSIDPSHSWSNKPYSRLVQGRGCPACSKGGFDPSKKGYLYLHKILHEDRIIWYKLGISNNWENRLKQLIHSLKNHPRTRKFEYENLEILIFNDGFQALKLESLLKRKLKNIRAPNVKNLSGGNELFLSNPLDEARKIGLID
jgi:predicted  nucleic acid-binding Zn-ribbon protein